MSTIKAIRLSINDEVSTSLKIARRKYPALSDAELLKVGLSMIVTEVGSKNKDNDSTHELHMMATHAVGRDYLTDPAENIYDNA
jgi:hypothetical protein